MKNLRYTMLLLAAGFLMGGCGKKAALSAEDARIERLLSQMTIEEKIGQLNQISSGSRDAWMTDGAKSGSYGSVLNEVDPATINYLQREAVEKSRLGIPLIFARDVVHGFRTLYPLPIGQAATFNPALVREGARLTAEEAASSGIRWTFSPMVDIARDPRWGRIAEGYGEDPLLCSAMGAATVRGYQGDDLSAPNTMAACVKHFAGYGAAEGGRDYNTTWIPTELLFDVYLPGYKACCDAGAATLMCSFNDINGVPSSGNKWLLRDLLRDQWGWDGAVVSDWNSIGEMVNHAVCADKREAAIKGAEAGVDMDMMSFCYSGELADLVRKGDVSEKCLDGLVRNVLRLKSRLGLFENPYVDEQGVVAYSDESLSAALRTAEEAAVLLTNNGMLPLRKGQRILVTGPMADAPHDQCGTWSFDLEKSHTVTPLPELKRLLGEENVVYVPGLAYSRDRNKAGFAEAIAAADSCDAIIFIGGEEAVLAGEAHSRTDITLPGAQREYIAALKATGKPLAAVIMAGRPLALADEKEACDAILFNFHPGTMGGTAIANILTGVSYPGGKLPSSFPRTSGQCPIYYAQKPTGRPAESITWIDEIPLEAGQTSTGCTSFYLDAGVDALFPFGHGLSYTTFSYTQPELSTAQIGKDGKTTVSCTVTNTGEREGSEVAQLYVRDRVASLSRPLKELKGFEKFTLRPEESRRVEFELPASQLGFHNSKGEYIVEPGDFHIWVAGSSEIKGEPVILKVNR